MRKLVVLLVLFFALFYGGVVLGIVCGRFAPHQPVVVRDTIFDTIRVESPVAVDSVVLRHKTVRVAVYDTVKVMEGGVVHDTIQVKDSATVTLPFVQKHYSHVMYDAYVSGIMPNLDSLFVYSKTVNATRTKYRRWNIGVQGGYGYTPRGFQPYLGVGVTFNILR